MRASARGLKIIEADELAGYLRAETQRPSCLSAFSLRWVKGALRPCETRIPDFQGGSPSQSRLIWSRLLEAHHSDRRQSILGRAVTKLP